MTVFRQLLKEFWLPLIAAIAWAFFNIYSENNGHKTWGIKEIINIFGPTFFLASWITGQVFRVKKQVKVDSSLNEMENRLKVLLSTLELKTADLIGHISGGNSFPWLQLGNISNSTNIANMVVVHNGEHPLYDVHVRIVDLNKMKSTNPWSGDLNVQIGNLVPGHVKSLYNQWKIEGCTSQGYNIFLTARNGGFYQLYRMEKVDSCWEVATIVKNYRNDVLFTYVSNKFPLNEEGAVIWEK